nr:unnamed protein product [Digitaria exilis]
MAVPWRAAWVAVAAAALVATAVTAKECTNQVLTSHTEQARLQASSPGRGTSPALLFHGHGLNHDEPTSTSTDHMSPPVAGEEEEEFDWAMLYRSLNGRRGGGAAAGPFLEEVSLHDVRLDLDGDAVYGRAQRTNLEYLLMLDPDRLVWRFRSQSGLPTPGEPYGGWEALNLTGHFVGHYLSATAKMWASTHDATLAGNMEAVVDALHECQRATGSGYLSAFPAVFFDEFEALDYVWAPYYTIHKARRRSSSSSSLSIIDPPCATGC